MLVGGALGALDDALILVLRLKIEGPMKIVQHNM
jgi:hypothetical protein